MVTLGPFSDQDHKGLIWTPSRPGQPIWPFSCAHLLPKVELSKPRVSLPPGPSSGVNEAVWSGCRRSERTLTMVCKFQETPKKHCVQPAACMVQAHSESTEGPKEQTVPGHMSKNSSFWAQFHLLLLTFILSGLQRLGS